MSRHQLLHRDIAPGSGAESPDPAWLPDASGETLLVTGDAVLAGEVERVVAAAGGTLRTVPDVLAAAPFWERAAAVLVGSDVTTFLPRRRAPAVLVGLAGDGDRLWQLAAAMGAERVAVLPEASAWLAAHLSRSQGPQVSRPSDGPHLSAVSGRQPRWADRRRLAAPPRRVSAGRPWPRSGHQPGSRRR